MGKGNDENAVAINDAVGEIGMACTKIIGIAGLLRNGESTTDDLILEKAAALGVSDILRDCVMDIRELGDVIEKNLCEIRN